MTQATIVNHETPVNEPPRELAIPGTHARVVALIQREVPAGARLLDIGAGTIHAITAD